MARGLFAEGILVAEADPRRVSPSILLPKEAEQVDRADTGRRRQYAAGRLLARRLLGRLGVPGSFQLVNGEDRAPIWPEGFVGTISHTARHAVVAVAPARDFASLGCDVELDRPLDEGNLRDVCGSSEREWIAGEPLGQRGRLAKFVFSAKEAAFKAQYPLTGEILSFSDFGVDFDLAAGSFRARFSRSIGPWSAGRFLHGRWRAEGGLIVTAVAIRRDEIPVAAVDDPA